MIVLLLIILAFLVLVIMCCRNCNNNKDSKKQKSTSKSPSLTKNGSYNTIEQDEDQDSDDGIDSTPNSRQFKIKPIYSSASIGKNVLNDTEAKHSEEIELIDTSPDLANGQQSTVSIDKNKDIEPKESHINIYDVENSQQTENHTDSEELFGPGEDLAGTPMGTAGGAAISYTPAGANVDHHTLASSESAQTMDKNSIRSGLKAAEMTVGHNSSLPNGNNVKGLYSNNSVKSINSMLSHQSSDGEGFDWDQWLITSLRECFPNHWQEYLSRFKQQRITEDVLISLNTDKQNKGEVWKELIPIIGDRIRFQKMWDDELMRRQLTKK